MHTANVLRLLYIGYWCGQAIGAEEARLKALHFFPFLDGFNPSDRGLDTPCQSTNTKCTRYADLLSYHR